jgi:hypothetical protein
VLAEIDKDIVAPEFHPLESFMWHEIDLAMETISDIETLKNEILNHAEVDKLLKVNLSGLTLLDTGLDLTGLRDELEGNFLHLEIIDNTTVLPGNISDVKVSEKTMLGQYLRVMVDKINNAEGEERTDLEESLKVGYSILSGREVW